MFGGGSPATLVSHVDLFEEYVSPNDEFMMEHAKNETGFFTPFNADGSVILVNKNIVGGTLRLPDTQTC